MRQMPCFRRSLNTAVSFGLLSTVGLCHAATAFQNSTGHIRPASAHLDFRIVILPSMGLVLRDGRYVVQGNGGQMMLQTSMNNENDGSAPASAVSLKPHREVVTHTEMASSFAGTDLVTLAAP